MTICKTRKDTARLLSQLRQKDKSIGFVPTMGALHKGHISLIKTAKEKCPVVASSIFVNPTQFNNAKDFEKYPVTIERDIEMLEEAGCDFLFLPPVNEMYPDGLQKNEYYNLGFLETVLDGKFRPGHFQGVCQVVELLLKIIQPDVAFFGQKDYQQCMVIKKLVELKQLNTEIIVCPTLREASGLAMSSRNMRLSDEQKIKAARIYETLVYINNEIRNGATDLVLLKEKSKQYLIAEGFKPDYVEIANANTLELMNEADGKTQLVALIAAFLGEIRLIDNKIIEM